MSPLNRGPLLGPRMLPVGMRPPLPRFGGRLPPPGVPPRMPPRMPPPISPMFGPLRQRMPPPRPGGPPLLFGPRNRGLPPLMPPIMGPRGIGPRGPLMRPGPRGMLPPQNLSHMRPRFPPGGNNTKGKGMNNAKKVSKLEELELKKPWMTDEIRSEIQKKNKLYAKAKKNKDAKEWEEFKDVRNKVTRMIRDAKNEYLAKHPEQVHLYQDDEMPYDQRDENYMSSEDESVYYCEVCDREFPTEDTLAHHKLEHAVCNIDGCTFSAHPKLVEKHISMQHRTGLYHRMKNLTTPEDIQKWIAERKRKYPTKANIELQKAEELEKRQRGEIIKQNRKHLDPRSRTKIEFNKTKKHKRRRHSGKDISDVKSTCTNQLYRGLHSFSGTTNLQDSYSEKESLSVDDLDDDICQKDVDKISDDEDQPNTTMLTKIDSHVPQFSLVANYESDSDEDNGPEEVPIKRIKIDADIETCIRQETKSTVHLDKCNVEEKASEESCESKNQRDIAKNKQKRLSKSENISNNNAQARSNAKNRKRDSKKLWLLNRLLSRSIQHERNLICQCIKYIVDSNFLDE